MRSNCFRPSCRRPLVAVIAAACLTVSFAAAAQTSPSANDHPDSRIDLYGGYGYFHPITSGINGFQYRDVTTPNATASLTGWLNRYIGIQIEGGYFSGNGEHRAYLPACSKSTCDQLVYTAQGGPELRLPLGRFVPFVHALGGGTRANGPAAQQLMWGWGVTGGGGFDYVLPFFNSRIAIRPIQADFQYSQIVYGPLVLPAGQLGGFGELDALKLSGGLVVRFGDKEEKQPVMLGCTAEPVSVHPGETVTVTGTTLFLNPKHKATYTWSSNGGKLTPAGPIATVDTTGMSPGEYTVVGHVVDGLKARQQASCNAPFSVVPFDPPSLTCTATPATTTSGTPVDISTSGTSPQNRPLTYSYSTTAGQILGTGPTARLTTAGLGEASITVTCNVVDDLGQSARATADIKLTNPPVPVLPQTQSLCTIGFNRDRRRPVRVDNESKACLDDIALTLNQQTSARLEIVGNASADEKPEAAAQRALNERQYLTLERGIDPARIEVRVGDTSGRTVRNTLVPVGAVFSEANTSTFNAASIPGSGQAYGTSAVHAHAAARRPRRRKRPATQVQPLALPPVSGP